MESRTLTINQYHNKELSIDRYIYHCNSPVETGESNPVFEKLAAQGCENFFDYIELLGLVKDSDLIVLPSSHHYYYDAEDLKDVKTIINQKQLNHIKQIKDFLHTVYCILPQKSYFIGNFVDGKNQNQLFRNRKKARQLVTGKAYKAGKGIVSKIPFINMLFNILTSRTDRYMTKITVRMLAEEAGLKVIDMTEFNGFTYFCTHKVQSRA